MMILLNSPAGCCISKVLHDMGCLNMAVNFVQEFSEWGQCQVLELASHHRPSGEQEVYDLMNILDDRLCHSNSAVAMATIKVFLHLTLSMPATHQQVEPHISSWP